MTTRTEIINRALAAISAQSDIVNQAENSKEAVAARLLYDPTRQQLLRAAHWNFARKTAYLTLLKSAPGTPENTSSASTWEPATMPAPPWFYEYLSPADSMAVRYITPQLPLGLGNGGIVSGYPAYYTPSPIGFQPQRFQLATDNNQQGQQINVILTNQPQAIAIYTVDVLNESLWDPLFQEAMVAALASRFAMTISGDKTLARMTSQQAMQAVTQARVSDGNEGLTVNEHIPDYIRIRGYAGDWSTGVYVGGWITPGFLLI